MAVFLLGFLIVLGAALVVSLPLLSTAVEAEHLGAEPRAASWEREKHQALAAIKDAEFDYLTGKLSAEDYRQLRSREEGKALAAMEALEPEGEKRQGR